MAEVTSAPAPDAGYDITQTPFPAPSKSSSASINNLPTTATSLYFADKILITVVQNGRLAHWVHVPLDVSATHENLSNSHSYDADIDVNEPSSELLPMHQLTATTILGGTVPELDVLGQTLATNVASAIKTRNDREMRTVVLGLGLDRSMSERAAFSELVGLVLAVL